MPKWVLDGMYSDAYRGVGKKIHSSANGGNKAAITYGAEIRTHGDTVTIKSRLPNFAMLAHLTTVDAYWSTMGGAYGEAVIAPFIPIQLTKPGEFSIISTSQMVHIGQRRFMFLLRGRSAETDSYFLPIVMDQKRLRGYCIGAADNTALAISGVSYANAVGAVIEPMGEFSPGVQYTAIWYTAPLDSPYRDRIILIENVDLSIETPPYINVWPPAGDVETKIVYTCAISAGVLAILYERDGNYYTDSSPALRIRNLFTGVDIADIPLKDIDDRFMPFTSSTGGTRYPMLSYTDCGICVTDVGTIMVLLRPLYAEVSPVTTKVFVNDAPFSLSWHECADFGVGSAFVDEAFFGGRTITSLAPGHAVAIVADYGIPVVAKETYDNGASWITRSYGEFGELVSYPYTATAAHYTPDATGKLIPDAWSWIKYEPNSIKINTYSTPWPTAESKVCEVPVAFEALGLGTGWVSLGHLAYCGDERGRVPLKAGHDGVLEYAEP